MDNTIGVHMIDRWTYYALEFLEKVTSSSQSTLADFVGLKLISQSGCELMHIIIIVCVI